MGHKGVCQISPIGAMCRPAGQKPQNCPLSNLNTSAVLCAMLPENSMFWPLGQQVKSKHHQTRHSELVIDDLEHVFAP